MLTEETDFITDLDRKLSKHIKNMNVEFKKEWYLWMLILSPLVIGLVIYLVTESGQMAVIIGLLGVLVPELTIQVLKKENEKKFEERYAKSLEQLSSSLRAGMSITQAVEDVANCKFVHESMRKKYAKISSDLQMGITVAEAFHRFEEGTNSEDAKDLAIAIDVQNDVGGHEADVIKEIANNIHGRMMLRREIKSEFASTTAMCWIMDFICPLTMVAFTTMNTQYVDVYFSSPTYTAIFVAMIVMMLIGSFINHKTLNRIKKGV